MICLSSMSTGYYPILNWITTLRFFFPTSMNYFGILWNNESIFLLKLLVIPWNHRVDSYHTCDSRSLATTQLRHIANGFIVSLYLFCFSLQKVVSSALTLDRHFFPPSSILYTSPPSPPDFSSNCGILLVNFLGFFLERDEQNQLGSLTGHLLLSVQTLFTEWEKAIFSETNWLQYNHIKISL